MRNAFTVQELKTIIQTMEQIPDAVDTMPVTLRTQEAVYGLKKQADVLLKIGMVK